MPLRNHGTLLEQVVLLEVARLLFEQPGTEPVDFANSFALPLLSDWKKGTHDAQFDAKKLLANVQQPGPVASYSQLLASTCAPDAKQGPNGALLIALLARWLAIPLRMWLNDDLPVVTTSLKSLPTTLDRPSAIWIRCDTSQADRLARQRRARIINSGCENSVLRTCRAPPLCTSPHTMTGRPSAQRWSN
jgi:hypothetical protein